MKWNRRTKAGVAAILLVLASRAVAWGILAEDRSEDALGGS
ncbi:hypothetical protein [Streptomyces atratus]